MGSALSKIDGSQVLTFLSFEEREQVQTWERICVRYQAAPDKAAALSTLASEFSAKVRFSPGTLYRKFAAWKAKGTVGLVSEWGKRKVQARQVEMNPAFTAFWQTLWARSQRKTSAAWRALVVDHLVAGQVIPGYGSDWRGIFLAENPGWPIPEACPYCLGGTLPEGWSYRNMLRLAENAYARTAARIGTAAAKEFLPSVPRTRVGLPFASVFVMDDVEHDCQVTFAGNLRPQGVVELGALELLTGHYCTWGLKPIREKVDGGREKLREDFNRYLIAHIVCGLGFCADGCLIVGEHGTAKLPGELQATLSKLTGGLVKFTAGGIMNLPIASGLPLGMRRGNFRLKAALESHHNLKKNEMGLLPGQKGADPEHAPEDLESHTQEHRALVKALVALGRTSPAALEKMQMHFPHYSHYIDFVTLLYQRISERTEHRLEGWEDCGFVAREWRLPGDPVWKPHVALEELAQEDREALEGVLLRHPEKCLRNRLLSPVEAYRACQVRDGSRLARVPDSAIPMILGENLAVRAAVSDKLEVTIPDPYIPNRASTVAGYVRRPEGPAGTLARGREYLFWLNPIDGTKAFVADIDGSFLGVCPVLLPGTMLDTEAYQRNIQIVKRLESAELKRLAPIAEARLRERSERIAHNVNELTGRPVAQIIESERLGEEAAEDGADAILELAGARREITELE